MSDDAAEFGAEDEDSEEADLQPRTAQEVARRVIALILVSIRAFNMDSPPSSDWADVLGVPLLLSDRELSFFLDATPTAQSIVNFTWRSEALVPLVWALGMIEEMPPLNQQVDWGDLGCMSAVFEDPQSFVAAARLRPHEELEEMEGQLFHQHWRARDAQWRQLPTPEDLDASIIQERRYAASWLVGWGDDWDNVPMDT